MERCRSLITTLREDSYAYQKMKLKAYTATDFVLTLHAGAGACWSACSLCTVSHTSTAGAPATPTATRHTVTQRRMWNQNTVGIPSCESVAVGAMRGGHVLLVLLELVGK